MLFQNNQIDLTTLPRLENITIESLSPSYLTVSYLGTTIFYLIVAILLTVLHFFAEFEIPFWLKLGVAGVWLFLFLFTLWHTYMNFRVQGFAIRERDLTYRSGVFFRSTTVIPYNRIQHAEVKQGPIERRFGLQQLEIYTAGGDGSDLFIPGLPGNRADQLRDYIIEKAGKHDQ